MPWRYFKIVALHSRSDVARYIEMLLAAAWCARTDGWCEDGSIYNVKDVGERTERGDTRSERRVAVFRHRRACIYIQVRAIRRMSTGREPGQEETVDCGAGIVDALDLTGLALNGNKSSTATSSSSDSAWLVHSRDGATPRSPHLPRNQ